MKQILVFAFAFLCIRASGQQVPSQIQAKKGIFTDRIFLKDKSIHLISTNLGTSDSEQDDLLATGSAIKLSEGNFIQNQSSVPQLADLQLKGKVVIGSHNSFKNILTSGSPASVYVTQGSAQYGLSIQRASNDQGPADIVMYSNRGSDFGSVVPPFFADGLGKISFTGIAGDNKTTVSPFKLTGFVERSAPPFTSSGFIFNTTDSSGAIRETDLNAQGHLMLGYVPSNPTTNKYTLNVASGDVRFNSLSNYGDVVAGSDNNGVISKLIPGNGLHIEDSTLFLIQPEPEGPGGNYQTYTAVMDEYEQGNPMVYISESSIGGILWTRDSVGHYTGTYADPEGGPFYYPFTWLHSHASDPSGNVGATRLYSTNNRTLKLVVKDSNLNDTDVWERITIEVRIFISG